MTVKFSDPKTMPRRIGYSQVAEVTKGKIVLIAGQVPHDTCLLYTSPSPRDS